MTEPRHTSVDWPWAPIPEAVLYSKALDPLAVRVYGCLLRHGLDPSNCRPSHQRIGSLIGVSKRSVNRPLRDLEAAGWITRVPRYDGKERLPDGFHVRTSLSALPDAPSAPSSAQVPAEEGGGSTLEGAIQREPLNESQQREEDRAAVSDDVRRLCDLLASLMVENGCRPPTMTKSGWYSPMRLLLERDDIPADKVERAIRWATKDEFWRGNILSPGALRRNYDALRLAARRSRPGSFEATKDSAQEYLQRKEATA